MADADKQTLGDLAVPPLLERRLWAAGIDMVVVVICCAALMQSFNPLSSGTHPWLWIPAAVVLSLSAATELLTGISPGKWLFGLAVRAKDGRPAPLARLMLRGFIRLLPVIVFLLSLAPNDLDAHMVLAAAALAIALCYFPACYIMLMRKAATPFDGIAGTVIVRAGRAGKPDLRVE